MGDIKQVPLRLRDITLLERIDAYAKRESLSRNDAILKLIGFGLSLGTLGNSAAPRGLGNTDYALASPGWRNERAAPGIVSSLNVQVGPTSRRGPLLKKRSKGDGK